MLKTKKRNIQNAEFKMIKLVGKTLKSKLLCHTVNILITVGFTGL